MHAGERIIYVIYCVTNTICSVISLCLCEGLTERLLRA